MEHFKVFITLFLNSRPSCSQRSTKITVKRIMLILLFILLLHSALYAKNPFAYFGIDKKTNKLITKESPAGTTFSKMGVNDKMNREDNGNIYSRFFLSPNEGTRFNMQPLLDKSDGGWYAGVGTVRTFLAGAGCEKSEGIILLDYNPTAVLLNIFNILYLKHSTSIEDYRRLMVNTASGELTVDKFLIESKLRKKHVPELDNVWITHWPIWKEIVTKNNAHLLFHWKPQEKDDDKKDNNDENDEKKDDEADFPYRHAFYPYNYMVNEKYYSRLKKLADTNKIYAIEYNLAQPTDALGLGSLLAQENIHISILEISNIGFKNVSGYATASQLYESITKIGKVFTEKSQLIIAKWKTQKFILSKKNKAWSRVGPIVLYTSIPVKLLRHSYSQNTKTGITDLAKYMEQTQKQLRLKTIIDAIIFSDTDEEKATVFICDLKNAKLNTNPADICKEESGSVKNLMDKYKFDE
ncbi:MAG: hypothetical protein GY754_09125 [bacterium]|nr:hypothetical protein [bacterium]